MQFALKTLAIVAATAGMAKAICPGYKYARSRVPPFDTYANLKFYSFGIADLGGGSIGSCTRHISELLHSRLTEHSQGGSMTIRAIRP